MKIKKAIEMLLEKKSLEHDLCQQVLQEIFYENAPPAQIAAFLVLLRAKPENADELFAFAQWMREQMIPVHTPHKILDIVGTGGDGTHTVNISTAAAILAASAGAKVAKHGNRAFSSTCGSADVLEALGVNIDLNAEQVSKCIDEIGMAFCFAPNFHLVTHRLRPLRKELAIPTIFNLLGPLLNPTQAKHLVLGVMSPVLMDVMAKTLKKLGTDKSIVVNGNGMDELSCIGPTDIIQIENNHMKKMIVNPVDLRLTSCTLNDLRGGNAQENAQHILAIFKGKKSPLAENIILNAAAGLWIYGLSATFNNAILVAREHLHNGAADRLLKRWIEYTHEQ